MTGRRFEIGYSHQVFFVDRLRLGCHVDLDRVNLVASADDPDVADLSQQMVQFDIPKQDLAAYRRAAAAFNAVMDEHEGVVGERNRRRRLRHASRHSDVARDGNSHGGSRHTSRDGNGERLSA